MELKRYPIGAVFLTVVVDLIGFGIVMPLLPLYADRFDATGPQIGLLLSSFSAMQFLFAPIWGRVSDRVGRKPVLVIGLVGSVVFYTVFGFADSIAWLFVARIGAGIAGATISTAAAYIADVTKPEERARGMALIGAAFGIGFVIGPPIGLYASHLGEVLVADGRMGETMGRALPGLAAAVISAVSLAWTLHAVREPERHKPARKRMLDLSAFREARAPRALLGLLLLSFCSVFAFSNFEGTLSLMLKDRFSYTQRQMGGVFLFLGISLAFAQGFLVRRLLKTISERAMIRAGFGLMAVGLGGIAFLDTLPGLLGSLAVAVTGFGSVTPSISSLVSRQASAANQGGTLGLAQSASSLGRIFGPYIGNVVYAPAGAQGKLLAPLLIPLFGDLEHHRRSFVLGALLAVGLMAAAWLLSPPPRADAEGDGGG